MSERLLRPKHVCETIGCSLRKLNYMIEKGEFPPPLKRGRMSFWPSSTVESCVQNIIADAKKAQHDSST